MALVVTCAGDDRLQAQCVGSGCPRSAAARATPLESLRRRRVIVPGVDIIGDHVEDALRELADAGEQRRLWLSTGAMGAEVSSFSECICRLIDDSGLEIALERASVVYTQPIDDRLALLRRALRRVDATQPLDALLEDPALQEVRALAQDVLRLMSEFRYRASIPHTESPDHGGATRP